MTDISIITVTLNNGDCLADCLESVKGQSIRAEHILIDGASTDTTPAVLARYADWLAVVVSEPDQGMYEAMNKGIALAGGDIIGILNSDDFYPSAGILEQVVEAFEDKEVMACYGDLLYVDTRNTNKVVRRWQAGEYIGPRQFYRGWMVPHPTFFVRRSVYERFGMFNPALGTAADYELMLRLLVRYTIQTVYIPEVLVHMRTGGVSNVSLANRIRANRMDRAAWRINSLRPYPWTLWLKPLRKIGQWVFKG